MSLFQNYQAKKVMVNIGGQVMYAFADGVMHTVSYDEPRVEKHVGADGFGIFTEVADVSGTFTLRLSDYSPSNGVMMGFALAKVPVPILVTNPRGLSKFTTAAAMINVVPELGHGREAVMNEWGLIFISGQILQLGAKPAII